MTDVLVERDGSIATVVFNRPRMRNAISLAMWMEIARVTRDLGEDSDVRAIVYRGAGRQAFASGADISEFETARSGDAAKVYDQINDTCFQTLMACPKPTIAMIHGYCFGGGIVLHMARMGVDSWVDNCFVC